jgi:ribonuclease HI
MPFIECDPATARERLEAAGIPVESGNTDHELWRASAEGGTAVAYENKVVIQGSDTATMEAALRNADGRAHLYVDGASRGNPGPAAIGWVIVTGDGGIFAEGNKRIGETTNNRAEYEALVHGLSLAAEYGFDRIEVRSDSELVVRQVTGEWSVNDPDLREYRVRVRELLEKFENWSLSHVPREINERADELANEAFEDG